MRKRVYRFQVFGAVIEADARRTPERRAAHDKLVIRIAVRLRLNHRMLQVFRIKLDCSSSFDHIRFCMGADMSEVAHGAHHCTIEREGTLSSLAFQTVAAGEVRFSRSVADRRYAVRREVFFPHEMELRLIDETP